MEEKKKIRAPRIRNTPVNVDTGGKVMPNVKSIEERIISAALTYPDGFEFISQYLVSEFFHDHFNSQVYSAMEFINRSGRRVGLEMVVMELCDRGVMEGKPQLVVGELMRIQGHMDQISKLEDFCHAIIEKYILRQIIQLCVDAVGSAYDAFDPFDLLEKIATKVDALSQQTVRAEAVNMLQASTSFLNNLDSKKNRPKEIDGVRTGFKELDILTWGLQKTDFIIIAARPAVGKTAFSLNILRNAAKAKQKGALFCLEMSSEQLMQRIISAESLISLSKIKKCDLTPEEYQHIQEVAARVSMLPMFIDDSASMDVDTFKIKVRNLVRSEKVEYVIVDYLQLMTARIDGKRISSREQEISTISRECKKLAKELNIPIIALSQLSRETEKRHGNNKIPQLSDLRDSGAIEQDADIVMFVYRPEYHGISADENGNNTAGETHIKVAKHRNGSLDTIKLKAQLHLQLFSDWGGVEIKKWEPKAIEAPVEEFKTPGQQSTETPTTDFPF
jgi:replicative DNA helicase